MDDGDTVWPVGVEKAGRIVLTENPGGYGDAVGLACPVCGNVYMHLEGIEQAESSHDRWTRLRLLGECGHRVTTNLNEHKGAIFVTTRREPDEGRQ